MPAGREVNCLWDMAESGRMIKNYVADKAEDEFYADSMLQDAVIRRFEVIGEAATRISEETRALIPQLPWRQIIAMRNRLIHDYRQCPERRGLGIDSKRFGSAHCGNNPLGRKRGAPR